MYSEPTLPCFIFQLEHNTLTASMGSVVHDILSGKSRIALAITEPDAGSDVRGLQTEAKLSDDGKHLVINGNKKVRTELASYAPILKIPTTQAPSQPSRATY